jgi:hypothetical protein
LDGEALLDLGGEDEIAFGEAVDFMRPDGDLHLAPGEVNVRVMVLGFSQFADLIRKRKRFQEVLEGEFLFEVMFSNDLPAGAQFCLKLLEGLAFECGHASFAKDTLFRRQFIHKFDNGFRRLLKKDHQFASGDSCVANFARSGRKTLQTFSARTFWPSGVG